MITYTQASAIFTLLAFVGIALTGWHDYNNNSELSIWLSVIGTIISLVIALVLITIAMDKKNKGEKDEKE